MRRRDFLLGLGGAAAGAHIAYAQQVARPLRVGFLGAASAAGYANRIEALRAGLREFGYVEGKNLTLEFRWAENMYDRLVSLATELVGLGVDTIVTHGTPGTRAAKQVTQTIPIVMAVSGDAVATKLVASLARPGGNVTGSSYFSPELSAKRLELLKEIEPRLSRVAFLTNQANPMSEVEFPIIEKTARSLGVTVQLFKIVELIDLEKVFSSIKKGQIEGVIVQNDGMLSANDANVATVALTQRLPTSGAAELPKAGGTIGYGPNFAELFRRAAYFIDKIAKGTNPSDLPVQQPTKFELVINVRTAKAMGLMISPMLLARADEVNE